MTEYTREGFFPPILSSKKRTVTSTKWDMARVVATTIICLILAAMILKLHV